MTEMRNAFQTFFLRFLPHIFLQFLYLSFQLDLPLDEFEGKLKKSKLKLVLTNGKLQG